jgi:hypothetical protein
MSVPAQISNNYVFWHLEISKNRSDIPARSTDIDHKLCTVTEIDCTKMTNPIGTESKYELAALFPCVGA